jgi:fused signal recognition particle receptor
MAKNILTSLFGKKKENDPVSDQFPRAPQASLPEVSGAAAPSHPQAPPDALPDKGVGEDASNIAESAAHPPEQRKRNFFQRLADGLSRTSSKLSDDVAALFTKKKLDAATIEELEELLIAADLGVPAAARVSEALAKDRFDREIREDEIRAVLAKEVAASLSPFEKGFEIDRTKAPFVILMVGVNGSGKTTTIGKLAEKFRREGLSVMIAAGDTFRAAAIEQLSVWGERSGAKVIARSVGADASGLAFDALKEAKGAGVDVLLIDTAGRLQNRRELMDELAKIVRVLKKLDASAPHATLLVLDATVGQNALAQAEAFKDIAGVTGLVMTKLDGTAKGGILVAVTDRHKLPIHFIGVGEGVDDLQPFSARSFARALAGLQSRQEAA